MSEKEEALESFKTQNAVLKNSVRYLPVADDESGDNLVSIDLKLRLTNLIRDTLHHNRDANRQLGNKIQKQLQVFSLQRDTMSASPQREALDQILAHVRTVFTQTPFVNTLTDTLTWMPLGQWSNALDQTYQRHHGRMMETAAQYRLYMYTAAGAALALGLLAAVSGSAKPAPEPIALQLPIREPQYENTTHIHFRRCYRLVGRTVDLPSP